MSMHIFTRIFVGLILSSVVFFVTGCYNGEIWPAVGEEIPSTLHKEPLNITVVQQAGSEDANAAEAKLPPEDVGTSKAKVRQAMEAYYAGLNSMFAGDMGPISQVWARNADITNVDEYGTMYVGWPSVSASLEREAQAHAGSSVTSSEPQIAIKGTVAHTWCAEQWNSKTASGQSVSEKNANNVFRRGLDGWKLIHRHNDRGLAIKRAAAAADANQPASVAVPAKPEAENLK